ncbi:MAG: hypothetical protein RI907_458 [Pseudomonadota bacterium]|jgi:uncharacterized protein
MARVLELLLIAALVIWVLYSPAVRRGKGAPPHATPEPPSGRPDPRAQGGPGSPTDTMVACHHCGVHLPASEAVKGPQGQPFCCPAHRDAR